MSRGRIDDRDPSGVRLPTAGEDATPFVLRVYVKSGGFRRIQDFEAARPLYDEYKLYVWRSATLRDVANLLYSRNTKLSSPTALHSFRIVYNNRGRFGARDVGSGVTRVSMASLDAATVDVFDKHEDEGLPSLFIRTLKEARPERPRDVDEMASRQTLEDIGLRNGDILDCAIKQSRSDRDVVGERPRRMDIAERDRRPSTRRRSLSPNRGTRVSRPLR